VLILASGSLSAPAVAAIDHYLAAGGRLLLFSSVEAPTLAQSLGVTPGEPETGVFTAMEFSAADAEAAPGLPLRVPQAISAPRRLTLAEGTRALGEWARSDRRGPPAVALGARGA